MDGEATPLLPAKTDEEGTSATVRSLTQARAAFEVKDAELSRKIHQKKAVERGWFAQDNKHNIIENDADFLRESVRSIFPTHTNVSYIVRWRRGISRKVIT